MVEESAATSFVKEKRSLLVDSKVSTGDMQAALRKWFDAVGSRFVDKLSHIVDQEWNRKQAAHPKQLCAPELVSLVTALLPVDPTLHPRHMWLATALRAEHTARCIFGTGGDLEKHCIRYARTILLCFSRYRELASKEKYANVWLKAMQPCPRKSAPSRTHSRANLGNNPIPPHILDTTKHKH